MDMAERIVAEIEEVEEAYCYLVSQIGKPITEPQVCDVKLRVNGDLNKIKEKVMKIAQEELDKLPSTWQKFLNRHFRLY
jgi:S-adenosylmethionine synthetase